jgi:hypothetical protein
VVSCRRLIGRAEQKVLVPDLELAILDSRLESIEWAGWGPIKDSAIGRVQASMARTRKLTLVRAPAIRAPEMGTPTVEDNELAARLTHDPDRLDFICFDPAVAAHDRHIHGYRLAFLEGVWVTQWKPAGLFATKRWPYCGPDRRDAEERRQKRNAPADDLRQESAPRCLLLIGRTSHAVASSLFCLVYSCRRGSA